MNTATFRFYADLNDLLPLEKRQQLCAVPTHAGDQTVKHVIEAQGVPHTEVALIIANGEPVTFDYLVQPNDYISVYPAFSSPNFRQTSLLRPPEPRPARFILDNHLGRLARYLRLLGFDTLYFNDDLNDNQLAALSAKDYRILLTRDRGLLKRKQVVFGYCLRTRDSFAQLVAVVHRYDLAEQFEPWKRCMRCNGLLQSVSKSLVIDLLEPKTKRYFDSFQQCAACDQVYWRGSHHSRLQELIARLQDELHSTT